MDIQDRYFFVLEKAGFCPEFPTPRVDRYNMLLRIEFLRRRDQDVPCNWKLLFKSDEFGFVISVLSFYFSINRAFVPGFFSSCGPNDHNLLKLYFENNFDRICTLLRVSTDPQITPEVCMPPIVDSIDKYIESLEEAAVVPVLSQDYSDYRQNGAAYVKRLPVIIQIVQQLPETEVIYAPCDGIGVVALACHFLGRKYVSYESFGIGNRAFEVGLIQNKVPLSMAFDLIPANSVVLLSNVSRYSAIDKFISKFRCVVLDELLTYPGYEKLVEVEYSGGRLRTHVELPLSNVMCGSMIPLTFEKLLPIQSYSTNDPVLRYVLPEYGYCIEPAVDVAPSVVLAPSVDANVETFVISHRKKAGARCGKFGQSQLVYRDWYRYDPYEYTVITVDGFYKRCDVPYKSRRILYGYEIPDADSFKLVTNFDPSRLEFARQHDTLIRIEVSNVKQQGSAYISICRRRLEHHIPKQTSEEVKRPRLEPERLDFELIEVDPICDGGPMEELQNGVEVKTTMKRRRRINVDVSVAKQNSAPHSVPNVGSTSRIRGRRPESKTTRFKNIKFDPG